MGRRSRKRRASGAPEGDSTRAERDAARARRVEAPPEETQPTSRRRRDAARRPPPPWGSFPLTELVVLLGLVLATLGFIVGIESSRGRTMFLAGVALGILGGLETSVRDHFAGYRSHTTLLSGVVAVAAIVAVTFLLGLVAPELPFAITLVVGAIVFAAAFPLLRRVFQRRSGGLSFR